MPAIKEIIRAEEGQVFSLVYCVRSYDSDAALFVRPVSIHQSAAGAISHLFRKIKFDIEDKFSGEFKDLLDDEYDTAKENKETDKFLSKYGLSSYTKDKDAVDVLENELSTFTIKEIVDWYFDLESESECEAFYYIRGHNAVS